MILLSDNKKDLLAERRSLLDKLFAGTITRYEKARLAWVRWQLDGSKPRLGGLGCDL